MRILDPRFKYTPSFSTDVTRTFREARKKLEAEKKRSEEVIEEAKRVVTRIGGRK